MMGAAPSKENAVNTTTITITDPELLARLAAAEGQIVFRGPGGELVKMAATVPPRSLPPGVESPFTDEQIEAALAHELGHVWIYTHHPYLQTEQLANRVAMRAVSRERLVEVYQALWGPDALHGGLEAFLGIETAAQAK